MPTLREIIIDACKSFMPAMMQPMANRLTSEQVNQFIAELEKRDVCILNVPASVSDALRADDLVYPLAIPQNNGRKHA